MISPHEYPVVGVWYWDIDHGERFEVVAEDKKDDNIEIQYFEGEVTELDFETWFSMHIVSIAAPEDWSGPFEVDKDQFSELGDETIHPPTHSFPDLEKDK